MQRNLAHPPVLPPQNADSTWRSPCHTACRTHPGHARTVLIAADADLKPVACSLRRCQLDLELNLVLQNGHSDAQGATKTGQQPAYRGHLHLPSGIAGLRPAPELGVASTLIFMERKIEKLTQLRPLTHRAPYGYVEARVTTAQTGSRPYSTPRCQAKFYSLILFYPFLFCLDTLVRGEQLGGFEAVVDLGDFRFASWSLAPMEVADRRNW